MEVRGKVPKTMDEVNEQPTNCTSSLMQLAHQGWKTKQADWLMLSMQAAMGDFSIPGIWAFENAQILPLPAPRRVLHAAIAYQSSCSQIRNLARNARRR